MASNTLNVTLRPTDFDFVSTLVRTQAAIVLNRDKDYLVETRLIPIAKAHGFTSVSALVDSLRATPNRSIMDKVVDAMTVNETSFFRDQYPFDALRLHLIPELLAKRSKEMSLSIWSNACSSGQEIYSIAMLLMEQFPMLRNWKLRLLATDLSDQMLMRAKRGVFTATEIGRGLPKEYLNRYFTQENDLWRISESLSSMIEFKKINLIETWPSTLQNIDIVFLRNVLIYFDAPTKTQVLWKARRSLRDDGFLFLGNAESTINLKVPFTREILANSTVYRAAPVDASEAK